MSNGYFQAEDCEEAKSSINKDGEYEEKIVLKKDEDREG